MSELIQNYGIVGPGKFPFWVCCSTLPLHFLTLNPSAILRNRC